MATCKECLHFNVCESFCVGIPRIMMIGDNAYRDCGYYKPAADVVPKSEVESLQAENERLTINMNAYGLTSKRLAEENENLEIELENMRRNLGDAREGWNDSECEVERLQKALDEYEETSGLKQAKAEVVTEFAERLKEKMKDLSRLEYDCVPYFLVSKSFIDKIAEEMKGAK